MKRFEVTYTNLNKECTLHGNIVKAIFGNDKKEAKETCELLYKETENFRIIKVLKRAN